MKTHWPSPVLGGHLAYRKVDAEDTSPGLPRSICIFGSCLGHDLGPHPPHNKVALVSVPASHVKIENQEMLSAMEATEIPLVDGKVPTFWLP